MASQSIIALLLASGRGTRLTAHGEARPKQYQHLHGRSIFAHVIEGFLAHPHIEAIIPIIHPDDAESYHAIAAPFESATRLVAPQFGGETRQISALNGLESCADAPPDLILIHDVARPFVSFALIDGVIAKLRAHPELAGIIPIIRPRDTIKRLRGDKIKDTLPRDILASAQTPQGFRFAAILQAYRKAKIAPHFTDDASIAEAAGLTVGTIEGDAANIKITYAEDVNAALRPARPALQTRSGLGLDVHRFGAPASAEKIMLGGIAIEHSRAIIGHSDADLALHAIADALYGAIADGDIGVHFPPHDDANKNRASADFVTHACERVIARGGRITHIDLTLICETPAIAPHQLAMRTAIAALLNLRIEQVSVKATTSEGLGFTGRGEGIAAQALATIMIPE